VIKSGTVRRAGSIAVMVEMRNAYSILVRNLEEKQVETHRRNWENTVVVGFRDLVFEGVNKIHLA
jgi:hypothetical protein